MATIREGSATVLLVVDVQVDVVACAWESARVVANVALAVDRARAAGVPVVWVQHEDEDMPRGGPGWQVAPPLRPAEGETRIYKQFNSPFEQTPLEAVLAGLGATRIVLAGAATSWCLRASAYAALERGYDLVLLEDAHTTPAMTLEDGERIDAAPIVAELNATLRWLSYPGRTSGTASAASVEFTPTPQPDQAPPGHQGALMDESRIRFDDGAAYEDFMGRWSQPAGDRFLDWLAPAGHLRWADIGCGNGAFTERLLARCAPLEIQGVDPSEEQLAFARSRLAGAPVRFQAGDAMALPLDDDLYDAAVMALVIFFVPEPARGVAEMARVVRPGGSVSAYAWDILGGGFPYAALQEEMAALGITPLWPPSVEAARLGALRALWAGAGLVDVETCEIQVQRTFASFDEFWRIAQTGPRMAPRIAAMAPGDADTLKARLRARLPADADGRITYGASANAIKGRRPA